MERKQQGPWPWVARAVPLVADGVGLLALGAWSHGVDGLLKVPTLGGSVALLTVYGAWVVCLWLANGLQAPETPRWVRLVDPKTGKATLATPGQLLFFYPSVGFGLVLLMAVLQVLWGRPPGDRWGENAELAVAGVALALWVAQLGAGVVDAVPRHGPEHPRHSVILLLVILADQAMLVVSSRLWAHWLGGPDAIPFAAALPLYVLFFAAPRLTTLRSAFSWLSLGSALVSAAAGLWWGSTT